ncbi:glycine-rich domain-containing protein [Taklimakanibacter deserti]|uniref:glycine-rich domain-containing protein n=1 Tax=Taklimakanibacter deserti TaxID=2267839 RepID=UPI000E64A0C9
MSSYLIVGFIALVLVAWLLNSWLRLRRAEFIRTYKWPAGLLQKLAEHHPDLARKDTALVSRGLRQFFIAYLMSGKRFVSMPSRVADDLWHEFILYTREYKRFCRGAFGSFLHHTPAVVLSVNRQGNEGLRRVWWYCCKYENIDPRQPTRLPLLFALDAKLNIPNGFRYHPQCEALRAGAVTAGTGAVVYCGGDFSSTSVDGSTAGFGDSSDGGDGGGDGGGCGGGGGD